MDEWTGIYCKTLTIALNAIALHGLCAMAFAGIVTSFGFIIGSTLHKLERIAILSDIGLVCIVSANWFLALALLVQGGNKSNHADQTNRTPTTTGSHDHDNSIRGTQTTPFDRAVHAVSTQLFVLLGTPGLFSFPPK